MSIIIIDSRGKACMGFADNLQFIRKQRGISQEALTEILHVTRQAVSKCEQGMAYPETAKIIEISNYFGVSIDYLLKK